jgi:pimeloyl-ACP methyl ester carboxylesterase
MPNHMTPNDTMLDHSIFRPTSHPGLELYCRSKIASAVDARSRTLLFVHGLGESGLCFERVMNDNRLAGHHRIAFDLPGYGKSLWAQQPLSLEGHALLLASCLEQEPRTRDVVVIGHSMGGVIGQILCERRADLVTAFLNVEGNQSIGDCGFSSRANKFSLEDFLSHGFSQLERQLFDEARTDDALRDYYPSLRLCDPRAYHLNSQELVALSAAEGLAPRMARLDLPTLYLFGDPGGAGARSQQLLAEAGVEVRPVAPAGHWPFLDQPGAFLDQVVSFVATSARSPG